MIYLHICQDKTSYLIQHNSKKFIRIKKRLKTAGHKIYNFMIRISAMNFEISCNRMVKATNIKQVEINYTQERAVVEKEREGERKRGN